MIMLGELNTLEMKNLLASQAVGRIACCDGGQPYLVPLTYVYDGDYLYGQMLEGKKLDILRLNPELCFEVDRMSDMRNWQSVVVYGRFEELEGEVADQARNLLFGRVLTLMTSATVHPHEHDSEDGIDDSNRFKPVMYRIKIHRMTGRFEKI